MIQVSKNKNDDCTAVLYEQMRCMSRRRIAILSCCQRFSGFQSLIRSFVWAGCRPAFCGEGMASAHLGARHYPLHLGEHVPRPCSGYAGLPNSGSHEDWISKEPGFPTPVSFHAIDPIVGNSLTYPPNATGHDLAIHDQTNIGIGSNINFD